MDKVLISSKHYIPRPYSWDKFFWCYKFQARLFVEILTYCLIFAMKAKDDSEMGLITIGEDE